MGNLSPRAIRERIRTPRSSPLASPSSPSPELETDQCDAEFSELCDRLTRIVPVLVERSRSPSTPIQTTPEPLDPAGDVETPPYGGLTASGMHRLRLSIVARLPVEECDSPFWQSSLPQVYSQTAGCGINESQ